MLTMSPIKTHMC